MGRIKTQLIKRLTLQLLKTHRESFKDSFDENKKGVALYLGNPTKIIRNKIAGYITRLVKTREEF
jgi:small subunit ribosomal protein S17e